MSGPDALDPANFPAPTSAMKEEAARWLGRHDRGLTPQEQAEFHQWLRQDFLHELAWEETEKLWEGMDRLTTQRAVLLPGRPAARPRWWLPAAAAACAALALGAWLYFPAASGPAAAPRPASVALPAAAPGPASAQVAPGGNSGPRGAPTALMSAGEIVDLSPGVRVHLKPGAQLVDRSNARFRALNLVSGEALFDVRPGADTRLFVVTAGGLDNGPVGIATQNGSFAVAILDGVVETKVVSGEATVSAAAVAGAATRANIDPKGTITGAGLIARVEYPSDINSETRVMPLGAAEFAEVLAWLRLLESSPAAGR